jgi:CRP-like cAMP-binding protein
MKLSVVLATMGEIACGIRNHPRALGVEIVRFEERTTLPRTPESEIDMMTERSEAQNPQDEMTEAQRPAGPAVARNGQGWRNRLLRALSPESQRRLGPYAEPVAYRLGDIVCEAGGTLEHVYFPEGTVLSLQTVLGDGAAVETANIGREGAYGVFTASYDRASFNRCLVQLEGPLLRLPARAVRFEIENDEQARDLFLGYAETLLAQVQQTVACNAMHSVEQKISRWLLMMHDRAEGKELKYTHEFLSHMLGANRKSITLAAQRLQRDGLIVYRRGRIQVADRRGLEARSCECYAVVNARFEAASGMPAPAPAAAAEPRQNGEAARALDVE